MGEMDARTRSEMHQNSIHGISCVAGALPRATAAKIGPWLLFDSGTGDRDFNQAMAVGAAPAGGDAAVRVAEEWFRGRSDFVLWLRDPEDEGLIESARRAGYRDERLEPAMLLDTIERSWPVPGGLDVRPVSDDQGVVAYAAADAEEQERFEARREADESLARAVMKLPGMGLFVGYVDGVPVARSMVVLSGTMAGVTNVYVAPSARRRGFGTAMTASAIAAGREMGATKACLEASVMGRPLYERMGFREMYRYLRLRR
jgi:GNAT superfamily N-acetyltransferase